MSELVVVGFENVEEADRVLLRLEKLKKEHFLDLEDAVVVVHDDEGRVHLKQSIHVTTDGATPGFLFLSGSLWGSLVGLLFLNPLAGFAVGGALGFGAGALSGSLVDYGINDDFIKALGSTIPADSSALFILVRRTQPEKVLAELSWVAGKVLHTSLSPDQETKLQEALAGSAAAAKT